MVRHDRDFYRTWDPRAVAPLIPFVTDKKFYEPCSGAGDLIGHLQSAGLTCVGASDLMPLSPSWPVQKDALSLTAADVATADLIITNPPFIRPIFHAMILHFSALKPTWLLMDSDWMHTQQSVPFKPWLRAVVSVGRVRWIPGTTMDGKDNMVWLLFDKTPTTEPTKFYGRTLRK
jgi:hypothetical protein